MAVEEQTIQFIKDQLSAFGNVDIKKMFGGVGEANIQDFKDRGSKPVFSEKKGKGMPQRPIIARRLYILRQHAGGWFSFRIKDWS